MAREIPLLYRDSFELDIESEVASGKVTAQRDGVQAIQAANLVRRAIESSVWHKVKLPPAALNKVFFYDILQIHDMGVCGKNIRKRDVIYIIHLYNKNYYTNCCLYYSENQPEFLKFFPFVSISPDILGYLTCWCYPYEWTPVAHLNMFYSEWLNNL